MQILNINYNIISFFVTLLPFLCNAKKIMTIIKQNNENLLRELVQYSKAVFGCSRTGFAYIQTEKGRRP
jgi:hypothetical protein